MNVLEVKVMQFTIQLIIPVVICIQLTHASLKVKFRIRGATNSADSYFNAASLSTANAYVGAQCQVERDLICEPLTFDWLSRATYKDDVVYLMKTCVLESFDEKVTFALFFWFVWFIEAFVTLIWSAVAERMSHEQEVVKGNDYFVGLFDLVKLLQHWYD